MNALSFTVLSVSGTVATNALSSSPRMLCQIEADLNIYKDRLMHEPDSPLQFINSRVLDQGLVFFSSILDQHCL
jgi:hypothetical protein